MTTHKSSNKCNFKLLVGCFSNNAWQLQNYNISIVGRWWTCTIHTNPVLEWKKTHRTWSKVSDFKTLGVVVTLYPHKFGLYINIQYIYIYQVPKLNPIRSLKAIRLLNWTFSNFFFRSRVGSWCEYGDFIVSSRSSVLQVNLTLPNIRDLIDWDSTDSKLSSSAIKAWNIQYKLDNLGHLEDLKKICWIWAWTNLTCFNHPNYRDHYNYIPTQTMHH